MFPRMESLKLTYCKIERISHMVNWKSVITLHRINNTYHQHRKTILLMGLNSQIKLDVNDILNAMDLLKKLFR